MKILLHVVKNMSVTNVFDGLLKGIRHDCDTYHKGRGGSNSDNCLKAGVCVGGGGQTVSRDINKPGWFVVPDFSNEFDGFPRPQTSSLTAQTLIIARLCGPLTACAMSLDKPSGDIVHAVCGPQRWAIMGVAHLRLVAINPARNHAKFTTQAVSKKKTTLCSRAR